jgi:cell division protein ZapE
MVRYKADLAAGAIREDAAQLQAMGQLQALYEQLVSDHYARATATGFLSRLRRPRSGGWPYFKGLYLWGGVGRGKTYLMDLFFESLPFEYKLRLHFHRFMHRVHAELREFGGEKNPLDLVAARLAGEARIICFDEFFVSDIADAMILAGLLEALFERGVVLVATSNIHPDGLYRDGLQRKRFLPAIGLLHKHTCVSQLDGGMDYRLQYLEKAQLYFYPLDEQAFAAMNSCFTHLAPVDDLEDERMLQVNGRAMPSVRLGESVGWFSFDVLCRDPRSPADFIELARDFSTVLLSDVPHMDGALESEARRFISFVDEMYDRQVNLVISAAVPMESLYGGELLVFEFARTLSRLKEMQSTDYIARPHRP